MFEAYKQILDHLQPVGVTGRVSAVRGLTVGVADFPAPMGAACRIVSGHRSVEARVIGFAGKQALAMPLGAMAGIARGDRVVLTAARQSVALSGEMLGRVLNGMGVPIDGGRELHADSLAAIWPEPIAPMRRRAISEPLATGVRAIDAVLTVGRGQRMGILAGSGVGKSVLLGMIGRCASADVTVIALIGERGREVGEFIDKNLGPDGLKRSVVVVATSDEPPLVRVQASAVATAVAEYFRDRGCDVLLLMDSLTRLAAAQRQIGLVAGEPPTTKGYTPSVFSLLPELLERCGRTEAGSITGFYTVLVEGDDPADPISDAVRAVTDGHVQLSRDLVGRGQYPAVDVLQSVSRVMIDVTDAQQQAAAREVQKLIGVHREIEELVNIGAYQSGSNEDCDLAIGIMPAIRRLLAQEVDEPADFEQTRRMLADVHEQIVAERNRLTGRAAAGAAVKA